MIEIVIVSAVACLASLLTFFSGFGLGTLLMPVVALFFSIEVAIGVTAVVHLANNVFKLSLLAKHVNKDVLLRFGLTAVVAAFLGAYVLGWLAEEGSAFNFQFFGHAFETTVLKLIVGALIIVFVIFELTQWLKRKTLDKKYLPLGGFISGFFGGLSGHQGAFRSLFLLKAGLSKEQFIATGVMVAVLVDVSRLLVYGQDLMTESHGIEWSLVLMATLFAFLGAIIGKKLLNKITIGSVQVVVSLLLVFVALGLITGLL
ncbi:MAG: sulfite exporter TauE/SafE family protein [Xanthomonadales bacterium]|nr:sulfite exporter TauE/SafE family protein [Xanthomonadales bacterium]